MTNSRLKNGIPVSLSLIVDQEAEGIQKLRTYHKKRMLFISTLAVLIAVAISFIARLLVLLINFTTQLFFFGKWSVAAADPSLNTLGFWVIVIPAVGGIIVGLMALYGSKAIRGHGIPEAMEQVLTNHSKIKPAITYLKPISAAIAIGAGGPFGAEGPIIATGGALGSTIGQLLKITANERKILLAAGATAGMSAIFGSPVAAIFLAIELLLFEFSPRAIIPVALACITGAAGHHFLFAAGPVFPVGHTIAIPSNTALFFYSIIGIVIGILAVGVTRVVYLIEDLFDKLPVHWMWWPAIGGLFVGLVGYFAPKTLGVGYENITAVINENLPVRIIISLCLLKFISWSIALGSGTSGGTLAPLLTIGGAAGALLGIMASSIFPQAGVSIGLSAMVGMAAMFSGASRAFLTSIIFALETTGEFNALLALLASCTASYFVSFFLMENTIMTEKISRRGVKTPIAYEPDILQFYRVSQVMNQDGLVVRHDQTIDELRRLITQEKKVWQKNIIVSDEEKHFSGLLNMSVLFESLHDGSAPVKTLLHGKTPFVQAHDTLKTAIEKMITENFDVLPVVSSDKLIVGVLSYRDLFSAYKLQMAKDSNNGAAISWRRRGLKMLVRGNRIADSFKKFSSS